MGDFLRDHDSSTTARRKREAFDGKPKAFVLLLVAVVLTVVVVAVLLVS